nr:hypothetical protein BaRGS_025016 [Batillaria attramentaria]
MEQRRLAGTVIKLSQYQCAIGYLNCMTVKDSASVYRKLHTELSGKASAAGRTAKDMEKLVTSTRDSLILVLDEIDQLDSKNQDVLYRIFEWPYLNNSKLILIGVANALDLTDRILPRLQAKPHCRPVLLHFAPYTRDQITAIITNRLTQCKDGDAVIENSAIQFCARKVSAVAGDMRKALDVCRRAVYESYCKVCRRQQMAPVDQSEFHSLCVLLEARGIIGMKKAKDTRSIKLTLRQDEKELEQTLQDRVLVSTILKEGLPK